MSKLYEVELNSAGAPDFSTAKEVPQLDDVRKEAMAQRWIPFSQHKPKTGQQILACSDDGVMWMTAFHPFNNFTGAWMPLPGPYAERRIDEQTD